MHFSFIRHPQLIGRFILTGIEPDLIQAAIRLKAKFLCDGPGILPSIFWLSHIIP